MRRAAIAVGLLGAGVTSLLVSMTWSCAYTIADGICHAPTLSALEAGTENDQCVKCLEQGGQEACCDEVGRCKDDGDCDQRVNATHACLLGAGPRAAIMETECRKKLGEDESTTTFHAKQAYQCMRDKCGQPCELPSCKLDPSIPRVIGPTCDTCIASACCLTLNECYKSRACRLTIDCIVNECAREFADNLEKAAPGAAVLRESQCKANAKLTLPGEIADTCVGRCLNNYMGSDFSNAGSSESSSLCLGTKVFECVATSGCASSCRPPPSPTDAATD